MDPRILAALITLASAVGATPTLAEELRRAEVAGESAKVTRNSVLHSVYSVALSKDGAKVGAKAFTDLGYNKREAARMTEMAIAIARKAGSYDNFHAVIEGKAAKGVELTPRETAMLRSFARRPGLHTKWDGRTWEGSALAKEGGRTWEGSEM